MTKICFAAPHSRTKIWLPTPTAALPPLSTASRTNSPPKTGTIIFTVVSNHLNLESGS